MGREKVKIGRNKNQMVSNGNILSKGSTHKPENK
jgi:hypothetical protein